jgi:bifunctional enzyme CysN/CysC
VEPTCFIPIAAKHGDNIASRSANMPWWQGRPCWRRWMNSTGRAAHGQPLRFPIQDVYRFDTGASWRAHRIGHAQSRRPAGLFAGNKVSTVKTIERWNAPADQQAEAGESIGITLTEQIFVERGAVAALETPAL